ncbi:MAG TPA: FAD-dependent oxidoreductase [Gammaproteobacteria bacterium]|nr:FAD-dependent oxidoreductase [Gammaproteobacteria bacterium]
MTEEPVRKLSTACCIVGGGPAGMMLSLLLARAGVPVIVLEKHADFLRDFRGDTVHPSTLQILDEIGLLTKFEQLPQRKVDHLGGIVGGREQQLVDFRGLKPFPYLALVPQWDFIELLAAAGRRYPQFDLRMRHEALGLIEEAERIIGVRVRTPDGALAIHANLVIACDGRHSTLRDAAGLHAQNYGAPMDVMWFRIPRKDSDPQDTFGIIDGGHMMVLLNRSDYWQAAYLVPKGGDQTLRAEPIAKLQDSIAQLAAFLADRTATLTSWDQVKTLEVRVDRLERWYRPGLLLIGDAAHAMSPIGGVGINLAIQDAVAAANALSPALLGGYPVDEAPLRAVQRRRLMPTKWTQALQLQIQRRVISPALSQSGGSPRVPALLVWLLRYRVVRNIPARIFGYGFRRERVKLPAAKI